MAAGAVVTTLGKNLMASRFASTSLSPITKFVIGTGSNTPTNADTDLQTRVTAWNGGSDYGSLGTPVVNTTNSTVTVSGTVGAGFANGNDLSEVGAVNTDGTPVFASRDVFLPAITKSATVEITFTWVFQITD